MPADVKVDRMLRADEICWQPSTEHLVGLDPDIGLGGIVVWLLRVLRVKNELLSVALEKIAGLDRELAAARGRNRALIEELRAARRKP